MKIKSLAIIAATFLLTGCNVIELTRESHNPGIDGSVESKDKTITYFDGDTINKDGLTAHTLTFKVDSEEEIVINKDNPNSLKDYINDPDNVLQSVDKAEEISTFYSFEENTNIGHGLKVGFTSDLVNGNLNLTFNCAVKAAEVTAYLRYGLKGTEYGNTLIIDENAAICANKSRYIKLPYQEEVDQLQQKVCSFNFGSEQNLLNISVYGKRAVITKIVVYS